MSGRLIPVSDRPWSGGRVSPRASCVLAPNASPMTLDGTNTWLLAEPDAHEALVIDPGPLDEAHLTAIDRAARDLDLKISVIALTHDHIDHAEGAAELAARTGAEVLAWRSGNLGHYLDSLQFLRDTAADARLLLPGHGPTLDDPAQILTDYVEHRQVRLQQVRDALGAGARTPDEVVDVVYAGLDPALRGAALLSTRAQLDYLAR